MAPLGDARANWSDSAVTRTQPITDRYAQLGMLVRERTDPPTVMISDHFCPLCAGQLAVDVYPEHFAGYRAPDSSVYRTPEAGAQVRILVFAEVAHLHRSSRSGKCKPRKPTRPHRD